MQISKSVMVVISSILIALCFATGYLLLEKHDGSVERAGDKAGPVGADPVAAPPAVVEAIVPETRPGAVATRPGTVTFANGVPVPNCSFDATVYDVRINADQVSHLDVEGLTKAAATREGFEKALAALGTTRQVSRANQPTNFNQEQMIKLTSETPYVTGTTVTATGQVVNSVAMRNTGTTFDLIANEGTEAARGNTSVITLDIAIKCTILLEGATQLTATVKAPIFRTLDIQQQRTVPVDTPLLYVNADANILDTDGKAVALIARVVLGRTLLPVSTQPAAK